MYMCVCVCVLCSFVSFAKLVNKKKYIYMYIYIDFLNSMLSDKFVSFALLTKEAAHSN